MLQLGERLTIKTVCKTWRKHNHSHCHKMESQK